MMKRMMMAMAMAVCVAAALAENTPVIVSSQIRASDPTILDVVYKVTSEKPTVNVRALAFEDGERSFRKVVRPETFVKDADGNDTAQNIGDNIAANVEHKLSWKVSADWKTDLAKVKFEVLTSEMGRLPLKTVTIPATGKTPALTVSMNAQKDEDIFNALMWHYADAAEDLELREGDLYVESGEKLSQWNGVLGSGQRMLSLRYIYDKMGWMPLENMVAANFVRHALRNQDLAFNLNTMNLAVAKGALPESLYVGDKAYWVVDLETGVQEYLDSVPLAGWGDAYKTTKLLLRYINPGVVNIYGNANRSVTITKPFYMGVFEVTQAQYALINGSNPSKFEGGLRPVESVSYNDIRGENQGALWPSVKTFDDASWLGRLQSKVSVAFDLPTESMWEYACRAGTTTEFNDGTNTSGAMDLLGRYSGNCADGKGGFAEHAVVGSYFSNAWGLHDMHGNVFEWCVDWRSSKSFTNPQVDYVGAESGSGRVLRGGAWNYSAGYASNIGRALNTKNAPSVRDANVGFRLCFVPDGL